ncbi:MAG: hypothetical protein EOP06_22060 [Proteobacteria bacterium]|nr:MAG: hypothetical protein EOP06_22060 [Pseudomonadota bacterium]
MTRTELIKEIEENLDRYRAYSCRVDQLTSLINVYLRKEATERGRRLSRITKAEVRRTYKINHETNVAMLNALRVSDKGEYMVRLDGSGMFDSSGRVRINPIAYKRRLLAKIAEHDPELVKAFEIVHYIEVRPIEFVTLDPNGEHGLWGNLACPKTVNGFYVSFETARQAMLFKLAN